MEPPRLINIQNSIAHSAAISNVSIGPRTGLVYATGCIDKTFNLWAIGNSSPCTKFGPLGSYVTSSQFDETEEVIVCGTNGGSTIVYNISAEKSMSQWSVNSSCIHSICFDPSNSENIVTASQDGKVQLLAQKCHAPVRTYIAGQKAVKCVTFSNDGRYIACGGDDKVVSVYDIRNSGILAFHELHKDSISSIQFHLTEPIVASGGCDRALHFFNFNTNEEIEPVLPLNTAEIRSIKFTPKNNVAIALSSQLLSVVGYNPPEMYDRFNFSIGMVHDMKVINGNVIIGSTMRDRVIINRVKLETLSPFSPYAKRSREPSRRSDANRLSPNKADLPRRKSESYLREKIIQYDEAKIYLQFRKDRAPFCTEMNERCSRLNRLADMIESVGLEQSIITISEGGDLQAELASACLSRIRSIKIGSAAPLFRVAQHLIYEDPEVALSLIDAVLSQFGKTLFATMRINGNSPELEERKRMCDEMIYAYRDIIPDIQSIANENSPLGRTANEILSEWDKLID